MRGSRDVIVDLGAARGWAQGGNYFRAAAIILFRRALRRFAAFR